MAQDHQNQFSAQKRFICPRGTEDRDKDKDKRQRTTEKGKGLWKRVKRYLSQRRETKDYLWIEGREKWFIGKCGL